MIKKFEQFINEEQHEESGSNYMTVINLKKLIEQSQAVLNAVESGMQLDHWATNHVATSADDIEEVFNYVNTNKA
jgi:hypothetical protein